jgi:hypothetical protein
VLLQEVPDAVRPKRVAHAAVVLAPALAGAGAGARAGGRRRGPVGGGRERGAPALARVCTAAALWRRRVSWRRPARFRSSPVQLCRCPASGPGHTWMSLSGSAHRRSQSSPLSGTSVGRATRLICSRLLSSGLRPPCMHRIWGECSRCSKKGGKGGGGAPRRETEKKKGIAVAQEQAWEAGASAAAAVAAPPQLSPLLPPFAGAAVPAAAAAAAAAAPPRPHLPCQARGPARPRSCPLACRTPSAPSHALNCSPKPRSY